METAIRSFLADDHDARLSPCVDSPPATTTAMCCRAYFEARDQLEPLTREELLIRSNNGSVLILDVRPQEEYRAGHIPGAISLPLGQLEERLADLPRKPRSSPIAAAPTACSPLRPSTCSVAAASRRVASNKAYPNGGGRVSR